MTRQEIIYRCLIYIDYLDERCEGVLSNLKQVMKDCGFHCNGSQILTKNVILSLFPSLKKFDLRLPDLKYKKSVLIAAYYFCRDDDDMKEDLKKNLEKYDIPINSRENSDFW